MSSDDDDYGCEEELNLPVVIGVSVAAGIVVLSLLALVFRKRGQSALEKLALVSTISSMGSNKSKSEKQDDFGGARPPPPYVNDPVPPSLQQSYSQPVVHDPYAKREDDDLFNGVHETQPRSFV